MGVRALIDREVGYLREDVAKLRARVRSTPDLVTPQRKSAAAVVLGVAVVVYSLEQWSPVIAGIVAGLCTVVYGFLFVDLDAADASKKGRRWRR